MRPARAAVATTLVILALGPGAVAPASPAAQDDYGALVELFEQWREFESPALLDGVPDYTAATQRSRQRSLAELQSRLSAFEVDDWPVERRIDWHLLRAEMNGLDFDLRVRKPWANNPAFYVSVFPAQSDVPAHEGPVVHGWIDLWTYPEPLTAEAASELTTRVATIAPLLEQARGNLVGPGRDIWELGIDALHNQSADLAAWATRVAGTSAALDGAISTAIGATDRFAEWLESELRFKNGLSGVGKDNYTWYLQNVHYLPYTWEELVALMQRELWRSHAALRLEENRNRALPTLTRFETPEQYDRALNDAVTEYMQLLDQEEIVAIRPYMDAALRARIGTFSAPTRADGLRGFFSEVQYRDGMAMRTHGYHWFDLARMDSEPHESPIRRVPLLSNIWDGRAEGMATGMEEMMMHAGLFDGRPRARELIWILLAQRAARAMGGLMMHGNEWTLQEAIDYAAEWTPRGWLPADGATVRGEQHLYLVQPVYGVSYVIGKIEVEKLLAEYANRQGETFVLQNFFDAFNESGVIPVSLIRWEMTGDGDEIRRLARD